MSESTDMWLARHSEKMKSLEKNDIAMAQTLESMHKIISVSNGTPSLIDQMKDIRHIVEEFISEYKAEQAEIKQKSAKWENRVASMVQNILQWAVIAYLTYLFINKP